jgi:hypothetical protein
MPPPPRATPRLGGAAVSCQYVPCSFVLALRELGLRLGVKAPLPLRALAPVESSLGLVLSPVTAIGYRAVRSLKQLLPNRDPRLCTASWPFRRAAKAAPVADEVTGDGAWACFRRRRKWKP